MRAPELAPCGRVVDAAQPHVVIMKGLDLGGPTLGGDQTSEGHATGAAPPNTPARLLEVYYSEYRQIARRVIGRDNGGQLIQPTELANEAALRLIRLKKLDLAGRTHFLSLSARVMRQVLIDEVRRHRSQKRQAPPSLTLWPGQAEAQGPVDVEALSDALARLETLDPDKARIVELRFFAGLTVEEIAALNGQSESTIKRQWRVARAWLLDDLTRD